MRNKKYVVIMEVGEEGIVIDNTNSKKDILEWGKEYDNNPLTSGIKIYQKDGLGYECILDLRKRKIGF